MRTSINKLQAGFTLVELLAVILIIGLGLGVGLATGLSGSPQQQKQHTVLLANALELAAQEAVLDGTELGLDFFANGTALGYRWLQRAGNAWQPYTLFDDDANEVVLPPELTATLVLGGVEFRPEPRADLSARDAFTPEVVLQPTRMLTPFTLSIAGNDGGASVLTADLMGRVRVDADVPPPP